MKLTEQQQYRHDRRKHNHGEAFCVMKYASRDGRVTEFIWNSRDGVTPFIIMSQGDEPVEMNHVNFGGDHYSPHHKPKPGSRIFVDMTKEEHLGYVMRRISRYWEEDSGSGRSIQDAYPGQTCEEVARRIAADEWQDGQPDIQVVAAVVAQRQSSPSALKPSPADELRRMGRELRDLSLHPETATDPSRAIAFKQAAEMLFSRASELEPFVPRKFS